MKVKVLRSFCIGNGKDVKPGDVIELSDREAKIKIKQGKVKDINAKEKSKQARASNTKAPGNLLYPVDEALTLIGAAATIAEVDEVIVGDTRKEVLSAAETKIKELEKELENEANGGD